jgi:dynein heavy chain
MLTVAKEIYFPLLTNPRNQEGWPEVITKEVQENLHRFLAQVCITIGNTQGITMLPLPPNHGAAIIDNTGRDKDRIHVLESAIVMWTKQIKCILKQDPETALKNGHPGTTLTNTRKMCLARVGQRHRQDTDTYTHSQT